MEIGNKWANMKKRLCQLQKGLDAIMKKDKVMINYYYCPLNIPH